MELAVTVVAILKTLTLEVELLVLGTAPQRPVIPIATHPSEALDILGRDLEWDSTLLSLILQH